ncbi:MAG TPA: response regulator [Planctomycetaceae bacterium]|nr:response regulator [Planctomycetaceae bacterium]
MTANADPANILVVDDLPEKLLVYETVLSTLGENLVLVSSGAQALKQVLHNQFAVILLDVNMPDMDGFETARLIRGHRRSSATPIIFLTAFADEIRTAEGYASGAVDYLPTPIVPEILRAKVRVFVELFKMRQQVAQRAEERAHHAAAEEANRRLAFLSDASAILGRSLDFQTTARDLVQLPIPFLSDASLLSFAPGLLVSGKHLFAQLNPAREPLISEVVALPEIFQDVARRALESGNRSESPNADRTGTSCVAIPLQARGRTFAVLTIGRVQGDAALSASDITLATALASRAATALDNALLHEELQKADRQKVDFLSMLAHELRNPLAPICNAVQLLRLQATDDAELQWSSDVIDRQVAQMVRLVDDLLDVSRITSGKIRLQRQVMDVTRAVNHAVEASQPLIEERNHRLSVVIPARPVWVDGDEARLTQVITNLLNNAAKYTEDGGQIQLTVRGEESHVAISVRDTGIGIPQEMLRSVFDLFTQVERTLDRSLGGLGIGLTLVHRLTEMHGGTVMAESEGPGKGSVFTVTLPTCCPQEDVSEPTPSLIVESDDPLRPKILIVDDNADATDTLATLFRLAGHQVQVAYDGPTGVTIAQAIEPAIVLLDIGLPGLDGYAVAERLREADATRGALLIAISGYGQPKDEARSRQAGFDFHLTKPVDFGSLQAVLQSDRWAVAAQPER